MRSFTENDLASQLEDGFKLTALASDVAGERSVGLRVHAVVRTTPDPAAGYFVLIRETPLARVLMGCAADDAGQPQEWLELWIQKRPAAASDPILNAAWDTRWRHLADALHGGEADSLITTWLENSHLPPATLNAAENRFVPLLDPGTGLPLELCTDERLLADAGLPGYGASDFRYLHTPGGDPAAARFVRLSPDAPANERTVDVQSLLPSANAPTLGLDGPAVIVRRYAPLSLEEFSDVAGGQPWKGLDNARKVFRVPGVYRLLEDADAMRCGSAFLFGTARGRAGRLAEALYLKLQAGRQIFRRVQGQVRQTQLPFLNLAADSFRVRLGATGFGLPFLWTAQADLVRPGGAYALPLQNTTTRYFQGLEPLTASVYRPGFVGIARRGVANVRIRKVLPATKDGIALEGTIRSAERLSNDENDLLRIHLPLSEGDADLLGSIDLSQAHSEGEANFRTLPQVYPQRVAAALPGIEGSAFSQLTFEILAPLSTPFDLYSLGVVLLRLLLANETNPLPDVLDRAFSLAHEIVKAPAGEALEDRIAKAFAADGRWQELLGYRHALHSISEADAGDATLPPRLWWSTLSWVLRLFPKLLPESFCKGYGDAPALALETVFDAPIRELDALLVRWRAFLLGDWRQNQEVARIIGSARAEV